MGVDYIDNQCWLNTAKYINNVVIYSATQPGTYSLVLKLLTTNLIT